MTRIELACYGLVASAFVLAAILVTRLDAQFVDTAHGAQVIARDNFTLMTARTRRGEEALFVLDNANARLLVYRLERKQLNVAGVQDLQVLFGRGAGDEPKSRKR